MTFVDYVTKATTNLVNSGNLEAFSIEELTDPKIHAQLEQWWEVVTFYTLRLAMAPIIGKLNQNVQKFLLTYFIPF